MLKAKTQPSGTIHLVNDKKLIQYTINTTDDLYVIFCMNTGIKYEVPKTLYPNIETVVDRVLGKQISKTKDSFDHVQEFYFDWVTNDNQRLAIYFIQKPRKNLSQKEVFEFHFEVNCIRNYRFSEFMKKFKELLPDLITMYPSGCVLKCPDSQATLSINETTSNFFINGIRYNLQKAHGNS